MGKYNFTERWKSVSPFGEIDHQKGGMIQKQVKGKPFNCDMDPDKKFVYETQAIQRTSIDLESIKKFKRIRAQGECLGIRSR